MEVAKVFRKATAKERAAVVLSAVLKPGRLSLGTYSRAFSSQVDTGWREENAERQIARAPISCNQIGKGSSPTGTAFGL
jgi:hypothetical protein